MQLLPLDDVPLVELAPDDVPLVELLVEDPPVEVLPPDVPLELAPELVAPLDPLVLLLEPPPSG